MLQPAVPDAAAADVAPAHPGWVYNHYNLPKVDRLWVYYNKIPIYPFFYLLQGDHRGLGFWSRG